MNFVTHAGGGGIFCELNANIENYYCNRRGMCRDNVMSQTPRLCLTNKGFLLQNKPIFMRMHGEKILKTFLKVKFFIHFTKLPRLKIRCNRMNVQRATAFVHCVIAISRYEKVSYEFVILDSWIAG